MEVLFDWVRAGAPSTPDCPQGSLGLTMRCKGPISREQESPKVNQKLASTGAGGSSPTWNGPSLRELIPTDQELEAKLPQTGCSWKRTGTPAISWSHFTCCNFHERDTRKTQSGREGPSPAIVLICDLLRSCSQEFKAPGVVFLSKGVGCLGTHPKALNEVKWKGNSSQGFFMGSVS